MALTLPMMQFVIKRWQSTRCFLPSLSAKGSGSVTLLISSYMTLGPLFYIFRIMNLVVRHRLSGKLKTPSKASAKVLSNLFPTSSGGGSRKRSSTFDPTAECVASARQKKKKAAIRFKASKITVILVSSPDKGVPKGKDRHKLKRDGDEQVIEVKRNMSAKEVKNCILRAFLIENYNVLKSTQDGKLSIAENQMPAGDDAIENITKRKFPLYICETDKVHYLTVP